MKSRVEFTSEPFRGGEERRVVINRRADRRHIANILFRNALEGDTPSRYLIDGDLQSRDVGRNRTQEEIAHELALNVDDARRLVGVLIHDAQTHELSRLAQRRTEILVERIAISNPVYLYPGR